MKLSWISFATSCAVVVVSSSAASTSKVTNDDLEQLYGKLSTFAVPKRVDPNAWLRECAYYIMKPDYNGSNAGEGAVDEHWILADYFYKGAKHGACTMKLESALGMSWNYTLKHVLDEFFDGIEPGSQELAELDVSGILNSIPEMTLPSLIAEPRTAKDAVEVVKFAKDHDLQVSVKNTGHDYAGQSDVKDSFQLNMRNFPKYSKDGAVECKKGSETSPLEGPPCKLALARGKEAIVRVSGSEGNDSVYQSVHNWNHQMPRDKRFQVSGGGEGAIGAGGGYLMGGGLGMGANDNKWGIFIDQVLGKFVIKLFFDRGSAIAPLFLFSHTVPALHKHTQTYTNSLCITVYFFVHIASTIYHANFAPYRTRNGSCKRTTREVWPFGMGCGRRTYISSDKKGEGIVQQECSPPRRGMGVG